MMVNIMHQKQVHNVLVLKTEEDAYIVRKPGSKTNKLRYKKCAVLTQVEAPLLPVEEDVVHVN